MKIFVKAFLDKNLGDDLMLLELFSFFPEDTFKLSCNNEYAAYYKKLFANYHNVKLTEVELCRINQFGNGYFDLIIQIGGSILQGNRNIGCYYRGRNIKAVHRQKRYGTRYYIIGCNVGPFINRLTKFFVRLEIMSCNGITVRDNMSYQFVRSGFTHKVPVIWADDLVMGYVMRHRVGKGEKDGALGISVMIPVGLKELSAQIIEAYARVCNQYIKKTHKEVKLLCYDSGKQDDVSVAKLIREKCTFQKFISIVSYEDGNYEEVVKATMACDIVIATRFHSMIVALSAEVPVYPIVYSNKMQNVLEDIDQSECGITMEEFAKGADAKLLNDVLSNKNLVYGKKEVCSSEKHFEFIKKNAGV